MARIPKHVTEFLAKKGIQQGKHIGQKPGEEYFEKKKSGAVVSLKVRSAKQVIAAKGFSIPEPKKGTVKNAETPKP